jgi:hypothetical protein
MAKHRSKVLFDRRIFTERPRNQLPPKEESSGEQLRTFSQLLLLAPFVILLLLGCGQLAVSTAPRIAFAETPANLIAEYGQWGFLQVRSVKKEIVAEIRRDFEATADIGETFAMPIPKLEFAWLEEPSSPVVVASLPTIIPSEPTIVPTPMNNQENSLLIPPSPNSTEASQPEPTESPTQTMLPTATNPNSPTDTPAPNPSPTPTSAGSLPTDTPVPTSTNPADPTATPTTAPTSSPTTAPTATPSPLPPTATPSPLTPTATPSPLPPTGTPTNTPSITGWYDCGWDYRKPITIDSSKVTANLTSFPVLIDLTKDADLAAKARNDGFDLLFTSSDGETKLSHEIESFDGASGALTAWVKVPSVSSSADTVIYLYYGNLSASDQQNVANVWSNNFSEVWHLDETSGVHTDSTSNGYVGTVRGTVNQNAGGQMDGADGFVGPVTESWLSLADGTLTADSPFTMEAWFEMDALPSIWIGIFTKGRDVEPDWVGLWLGPSNNIIFGWDWRDAGNLHGSALSAGTRYHAVAVFDGTNRRLYLNGTLDAGPDGPGSFANITQASRVGNDGNGNSWDGFIDEVRMSGMARSGGWITTEYNNQSSPGTFYSVGLEEGSGC